MNESQCQSITRPRNAETDRRDAKQARALAMKEERLPFTVRRVQTENDLRKAVRIRHAAYARHLPEFARTLAEPEAIDFDDGVVVLLAESKLDGSPIGTIRIQTNFHQALSVEQSVTLPDWLQGRRMAEVTRLGVQNESVGRIVKLALIKACFQYCELNGIEWALATGRAPIDQQYLQLLFADIFPGTDFIPLRHIGNIPHRVMAFEIGTGWARWNEANHPLLNFFFYTRHPDIEIGNARAPGADGMSNARPQVRTGLKLPDMEAEMQSIA